MAATENKESSSYKRWLALVANGGIAGFTGLLCTFPIDLSKTRLQNQQVIDGKRMYNGVFHCLRTVVKTEGATSLYRGILPNLVLIMPEKAIKLCVNDYMRGVLSADGKSITLRCQLLAGATAGCCQVFVTAPMEMMKIYGQDAGRIHAMNNAAADLKQVKGPLRTTEISVQPPQHQQVISHSHVTSNNRKGIEGKASKMRPSGAVVSTRFPVTAFLRQYGITGFYRGLGATLLRDIPFSMIYFPLFATLNRTAISLYSLDQHQPNIPFVHTLVCGVAAGGTAAALVNPADIIKTRLQSIHPGSRKYDGIVDCAKRIYKEEGVRAFMRGAQARAIAIAPLFGIAQSVYCLRLGEILLGVPQSAVL